MSIAIGATCSRASTLASGMAGLLMVPWWLLRCDIWPTVAINRKPCQDLFSTKKVSFVITAYGCPDVHTNFGSIGLFLVSSSRVIPAQAGIQFLKRWK